MQVKKDRIAEYKEVHRQVWPEVCAAITRHGWHRYSLFMNADGLVFGYFETETDFATALDGFLAEEGHAALGGSQRGISRNTGGRPQRRNNRTRRGLSPRLAP